MMMSKRFYMNPGTHFTPWRPAKSRCWPTAAPIEFCEVASMSMELMGAGAMDVFYSDAERDRANRKLFEGIIRLLPWVAQIDAFQHWIYSNPQHTSAERNAHWLTLDAQLGGDLNWQGLEQRPQYLVAAAAPPLGQPVLLHRIRHRPTRRIATLERLPQGFQTRHRRLSPRPGPRRIAPLPELFAAAGIRFDFGPATVGPLMEQIAQELKRIPD